MKTFKATVLVYVLLTSGALAAWRVGTARFLGNDADLAAPDANESSVPPEAFPALIRGIRIKDEVVQRFLRGELTLLEAAAHFHNLSLTSPLPGNRYLEYLPGDSATEKSCRQVIVWVRAALSANQDPQGEAIVAELQAELDAHIRDNGPPELPEVDSDSLAAEVG
jgi:hypothetical protein